MQRAPEGLPQDLWLIHDLVKDVVPPPPYSSTTASHDDCIDSSSSERDSDVEICEIEANLLDGSGNEGPFKPNMCTTSSESLSDSSSDSDLEPAENIMDALATLKNDVEDDDETGPSPSGGAYFGTKNELHEVEIPIPDSDEVGPDEALEKVGEVMSIVDNTVVVRGEVSRISGRASESALDAGTLLVFEDRKVLGYVYDTFGPTSRPLYQVKFNNKYPLDREKIRLDREVFHVPQRSKFVFVAALMHTKGSDASNVNDEEPAEDEIEFSDDEEEAAYKSRLKRKRGDTRAASTISSRHVTPTPSQMRDQDLVESFVDTNPYAEHGLYDIDYASPGPPRPPPIPYDDPYADDYNLIRSTSEIPSPTYHISDARSRDLDRPPLFQHKNRPSRGRGRGNRGRGRTRPDNSSGQGAPRSPLGFESRRGFPSHGHQFHEPSDVSVPSPSSPTSLAIARATGQYVTPDTPNQVPMRDPLSSNPWSFSHPHHPHLPLNYQPQHVQPHINPRFASAFGINLGFLQQQPMQGELYGGTYASHEIGNGQTWPAYAGSSPHASGSGPHHEGGPG